MKIVGARIITPDEVIRRATVSVEGGRIADVAPQAGPHAVPADRTANGPASDPASERAGEPAYDAGGGTLLPGFVDLHNHGALGVDFMDGRADYFDQVGPFLARHGVTGFLATTTAATADRLAERIAHAGRQMTSPAPGARCLGVHLEGPYLNRDLCGMHPPDHCRLPDRDEYRTWLDSAVVRRMTASLELPGGEGLPADCSAAGVLLSLGHTACRAEDVARWADGGLRHVTHLYNVMSRAEKRGPIRVCGCLEGALAEPRITAEIIGDGWHVPESLFRIARLCKGPTGITIASDATLLTGAVQEGVPIRYGGPGGPLLVVRNGMATSPDGTMLVGSIATLGQMASRLLKWLDGDWQALARILSTNAAGLIGLGGRKGRIAPGWDADLVLVDDRGGVMQTWVAGVAQIAA